MNSQFYDRGQRRRRPWLIALPLGIVVLLALLWSGFWFYAVGRATDALAGWRAREAKVGRVHACGGQTIGGFPFRIEVRCAGLSTEFRTFNPPLVVAARESVVVSQVYDPTLLIGEFTGPLTVAENGPAPGIEANWTLAQISLRGTSTAPQRVSLVFDKPAVTRFARGTMEPVLAADHLELHGRISAGSAADKPTIDIALRLNALVAPIHPLTMQPTSGEVGLTVVGLKDFAPKPWSARLREVAEAGGHIDVTQMRLTQPDLLIVGDGSVKLTADGRPNGQVTITVAGLERLVALLGIDQVIAQYIAQKSGAQNVDRVASNLDRVLPGLGNVLRNNSAGLAAAGISLLGEQTELEGRKAVRLPLRFVEGAMFLGPIPIGQAQPLF